ncbi:MAG: cation diffusion facilitator family transporter [Melioribacteraceae bacterium]|nr:cation diffusion facilitator family transporter [Melioribacteraceae bacterium]
MAHDHLQIHKINSTSGRLIITVILNFVITIAQIIGGIISGSLSLISDALHNLSDALSMAISYVALRLKRKDSSYNHTFGLKRAEILAAFINSSVLVGISIYLFYEAVVRFFNPSVIDGKLMLIVAVIGLAANVIGMILLRKDSGESMNIRSSYLHLLTDTISSVAVILGGLAIYYFDVYWIDPLLTVIIGVYILKESYSIVIDSVHVLMEGAPKEINIDEVVESISELDAVEDVHHIHVWSVGENDTYFEAHINVKDMLINEAKPVQAEIEKILKQKFKINHVTLQFECISCLNNNIIAED